MGYEGSCQVAVAGHVKGERDPDLLSAIVNETRQELGIDISGLVDPAYGGDDRRVNVHAVLEEHDMANWMLAGAIDLRGTELTWERIRRALARASLADGVARAIDCTYENVTRMLRDPSSLWGARTEWVPGSAALLCLGLLMGGLGPAVGGLDRRQRHMVQALLERWVGKQWREPPRASRRRTCRSTAAQADLYRRSTGMPGWPRSTRQRAGKMGRSCTFHG